MVHLMLRNHGDGSVDLMSCNERGTPRWYILRFNRDGTFSRQFSVGDDTGFQLDSNGRLLERE